jgi:hypothetical protein
MPLDVASFLSHAKIEKRFPCIGPLLLRSIRVPNRTEWRVQIDKSRRTGEIDRMHNSEGV